MAKKTPKATIKKAHKIAKAIKKAGSKVKNPYAVGMAAAKRSKKRKKR